MELFLLALLPFLAFGIIGGSDDDGDEEPDNGSGDPDDQILRDDDTANQTEAAEGYDLLLGAGANDTLSGDAGMDAVLGETGADLLFGGRGDDLLLGAWGQDELYGGAGADALIGGAGNDFASGGAGDDFLAGSSGIDTLDGNDGNDELIGLDARAELDIGDIIQFDRNALEQQLQQTYGDALRDSDVERVVTGVFNADESDPGADFLFGGGGSDVLLGDNGDVMEGGEGTDIFAVFAAEGDAVTTILDFDPAAEVLEVLVAGPATGVLTYRDDAFDAGVEVLLDGDIVAYLEGVRASQINPAALGLRQIA